MTKSELYQKLNIKFCNFCKKQLTIEEIQDKIIQRNKKLFCYNCFMDGVDIPFR